MPKLGDELHHYGWNACSSCLCPNAPHPHVERRYLVVPGLRSSRIYIIDTKPDLRRPTIAKVIEPEEVIERTGYSRTNSLYGAVDPQFYPEGIDGWMVKLDAGKDGGIAFDPKFLVQWPHSRRPHQIRLEGGDCSSDSYCYP